MEGTIVTLKRDRGFGFIRVAGQPDLFFHARDLAGDLPFDERLQERRVAFEIVETDKGPRARNVRGAI